MEYSAVNTIWVLLGAMLVFFMQAGFAMVETGLTRAKNAGNIIMKNFVDFCIGSIMYWLIGFGIMYGGKGDIIGNVLGTASPENYGTFMCPEGVPFWAFLMFQTTFCGTAATIVSGAMAERTRFSAYFIYSLLISSVIYPVTGHWIWGGGWLSQIGFHDLAGATAVHTVGGAAGFVGALLVGARIGKYSKDGKPKAIPGHNLTLTALGVFILWFSWFGFNGGSTASMEGNAIETAGKILVNTNLCAAAAGITAMCFTKLKYKKSDISLSLNGVLAGLVASTAGCDTIDQTSSVIIGIVAGIIVVLGVEIMDNVLKVDDPVGAVAAHGFNGIWGTIAVGIFSNGDNTKYAGMIYGGGFKQLGVQAIGSLVVVAYVSIVMLIIFMIVRVTVGLRTSRENEMEGLDIAVHNLGSSYAGFAMKSGSGNSLNVLPVASVKQKEDNISKVRYISSDISKVVIVTRQNKLDDLIRGLNEIGVTGLTISNVMGCGIQKGNTNYYRGSEMEMNILSKVKVEVIVSSVPVEAIVEMAENVLHTGKYGDGKIFVYDVKDVIKVRTGERGKYALVDTEAENPS